MELHNGHGVMDDLFIIGVLSMEFQLMAGQANKPVDNFTVINSRQVKEERLLLLKRHLKDEEACSDRSQRYVDDLKASIKVLEKELNVR